MWCLSGRERVMVAKLKEELVVSGGGGSRSSRRGGQRWKAEDVD